MGHVRLDFTINTWGLGLAANQEASLTGVASHLVGTNHSTHRLAGTDFLCMQKMLPGGPINRIA